MTNYTSVFSPSREVHAFSGGVYRLRCPIKGLYLYITPVKAFTQ